MNNHVPLIVDAPPRHGFPFVRCTYFYIDSEEAPNTWSIRIDGEEFPFRMLGLSGILIGPYGSEHFDNPTLFSETIGRIESTGHMTVECGHVWLPNILFLKMPERGAVLRAPQSLFQAALDFMNARLTQEQFREQSPRFRNEVRESVAETEALGAWARATMERSRGRGEDDLGLGNGPDGPKLPPTGKGPSKGGAPALA